MFRAEDEVVADLDESGMLLADLGQRRPEAPEDRFGEIEREPRAGGDHAQSPGLGDRGYHSRTPPAVACTSTNDCMRYFRKYQWMSTSFRPPSIHPHNESRATFHLPICW